MFRRSRANEFSFVKTKRKFLSDRENIQRIKHVKAVIDNVSNAELKSFFDEHHSLIFHAFYDVFVNVEADLKQKVNLSHLKELESILIVFEKILVLLPDLIRRRWQYNCISRIIQELLHASNAIKIRRQGVRLFLIWYQILGENAPAFCQELFTNLVPEFGGILTTIQQFEQEQRRQKRASRFFVNKSGRESAEYGDGAGEASEGGPRSASEEAADLHDAPAGESEEIKGEGLREEEPTYTATISTRVMSGPGVGPVGPLEISYILLSATCDKEEEVEDLTHDLLHYMLRYLVTEVTKIEWPDQLKERRIEAFSFLFEKFKRVYLPVIFPKFNLDFTLYDPKLDLPTGRELETFSHTPESYPISAKHLTMYQEEVIRWIAEFVYMGPRNSEGRRKMGGEMLSGGIMGSTMNSLDLAVAGCNTFESNASGGNLPGGLVASFTHSHTPGSVVSDDSLADGSNSPSIMDGSVNSSGTLVADGTLQHGSRGSTLLSLSVATDVHPGSVRAPSTQANNSSSANLYATHVGPNGEELREPIFILFESAPELDYTEEMLKLVRGVLYRSRGHINLVHELFHHAFLLPMERYKAVFCVILVYRFWLASRNPPIFMQNIPMSTETKAKAKTDSKMAQNTAETEPAAGNSDSPTQSTMASSVATDSTASIDPATTAADGGEVETEVNGVAEMGAGASIGVAGVTTEGEGLVAQAERDRPEVAVAPQQQQLEKEDDGELKGCFQKTLRVILTNVAFVFLHPSSPSSIVSVQVIGMNKDGGTKRPVDFIKQQEEMCRWAIRWIYRQAIELRLLDENSWQELLYSLLHVAWDVLAVGEVDRLWTRHPTAISSLFQTLNVGLVIYNRLPRISLDVWDRFLSVYSGLNTCSQLVSEWTKTMETLTKTLGKSLYNVDLGDLPLEKKQRRGRRPPAPKTRGNERGTRTARVPNTSNLELMNPGLNDSFTAPSYESIRSMPGNQTFVDGSSNSAFAPSSVPPSVVYRTNHPQEMALPCSVPAHKFGTAGGGNGSGGAGSPPQQQQQQGGQRTPDGGSVHQQQIDSPGSKPKLRSQPHDPDEDVSILVGCQPPRDHDQDPDADQMLHGPAASASESREVYSATTMRHPAGHSRGGEGDSNNRIYSTQEEQERGSLHSSHGETSSYASAEDTTSFQDRQFDFRSREMGSLVYSESEFGPVSESTGVGICLPGGGGSGGRVGERSGSFDGTGGLSDSYSPGSGQSGQPSKLGAGGVLGGRLRMDDDEYLGEYVDEPPLTSPDLLHHRGRAGPGGLDPDDLEAYEDDMEELDDVMAAATAISSRQGTLTRTEVNAEQAGQQEVVRRGSCEVESPPRELVNGAVAMPGTESGAGHSVAGAALAINRAGPCDSLPIVGPNDTSLVSGWTNDGLVPPWRRYMGLLGDVNTINDPNILRLVYSHFYELTETLVKIRENQGVSIDNQSTPATPRYIPPTDFILPWLFAALKLSAAFKEAKLIALKTLCLVTVRRRDIEPSSEHLSQFYRTLHDALNSTDESFVYQAIRACGPHFFSMPLRGSQLLILDFVHGAKVVIEGHNQMDAPRREAVSILGSLLCFPNHFGVMNLIEADLTTSPCSDLMDRLTSALQRAACHEPTQTARSLALASLGIHCYEQLTHLAGGGRFPTAINPQLQQTTGMGGPPSFKVQQSVSTVNQVSPKLRESVLILLHTLRLDNRLVALVAADMIRLFVDQIAVLLDRLPDLPVLIIQATAWTLNYHWEKITTNEIRSVEKRLLVSLIFALIDWSMSLPIASLLDPTDAHSKGLIHLVFSVLHTVSTGRVTTTGAGVGGAGTAGAHKQPGRMSTAGTVLSGSSVPSALTSGWLQDPLADSSIVHGLGDKDLGNECGEPGSRNEEAGGDRSQQNNRSVHIESVQLAAHVALCHLINHLAHFPKHNEAARLDSSVQEHDDLLSPSGSPYSDLSSDLFDQPNCQLFVVNGSMLVTLLTLPSQLQLHSPPAAFQMPPVEGGGNSAPPGGPPVLLPSVVDHQPSQQLVTGDLRVRLVTRDLCGRTCWDAAILYAVSPSSMTPTPRLPAPSLPPPPAPVPAPASVLVPLRDDDSPTPPCPPPRLTRPPDYRAPVPPILLLAPDTNAGTDGGTQAQEQLVIPSTQEEQPIEYIPPPPPPDRLSLLMSELSQTSPECRLDTNPDVAEPQAAALEAVAKDQITAEQWVEEQLLGTLQTDPSPLGDGLVRPPSEPASTSAPRRRATVELPASPHEPQSCFYLCRHLLNQLGFLSWERRSSVDLLKKSVHLVLELKHLDKRRPRDTHKIAVIYVGRGQEDKQSILSNRTGSLEFENFVAGLGWEVELEGHPGFVGGLEQSRGLTGRTAPYYATSTLEIIFHVSTRMPSETPEDLHRKYKHLGNDEVMVIWSEHTRDFKRSIIRTEFGDVLIVIYPIENGLFRIEIMRQPGVGFFGPLFDGAIVDERVLPGLVRATAINASRMIRAMKAAFLDFYEERANYLANIINKFRDPMCFEDFAQHIFAPVFPADGMVANTPVDSSPFTLYSRSEASIAPVEKSGVSETTNVRHASGPTSGNTKGRSSVLLDGHFAKLSEQRR